MSVLNQKTELQKAMEKHKGKQIAKEQEKAKQASLTPFQKALEQQALKLEQVSTGIISSVALSVHRKNHSDHHL